MNHFIYALAEDESVQYVGYTARLKQRRRIHARNHPGWQMLILGAYSTREIGLEYEKWWIRRLHEAGHPLTNICEGGNGSVVGRQVSYLTRVKMSAAARRMFAASPETRAKISVANKGRHLSAETRAKIGIASRGRHHSPEARAKISAAMKGKPWSQARRAADTLETRKKISLAKKGRPWSPETRAKIAEIHKSKPCCPQTRAKLSDAHKGRPWSPARRAAYERRKNG